jgi:hypothetical protein
VCKHLREASRKEFPYSGEEEFLIFLKECYGNKTLI